MYFKAFALTGRIADCLYTQGVALGYELLPFQGVLLWAAWPSGCAAMGCLTFRACCLYGLLGLQGVLLIWASWPFGRAAVGFWTFMAMLLWASWPFGRCCYCFKLPNSPSCTVEIILHALKGQKLLAQGNALGINDMQLTPCKGKSFTYRRGFSFF